MTIKLNISFDYDNSLIVSPKDIISSYLHGIKLEDRFGSQLSDDAISNFIKVAQTEVERFLSLKLKKQIVRESKNYHVDDWIRWGYIHTTFPVVCPVGIEGFYSEKKIIEYPKDWLSVRRVNSNQYNRSIALVPNSSTNSNQYISYISSYPNSVFWSSLGRETLPNYWQIQYVSGFDEVPADLIDLIGKLASLNILPILSDSIKGSLDPGISSNSISLDGLSKSISGFSNSQGGIFGARIKQYTEEIDKKLNYLKDYYCGIPFDVL